VSGEDYIARGTLWFPNIIRLIFGAVSTYEKQERCIHSFGGEILKKTDWAHRRRWGDNIKTNLQEVKWGKDWNGLVKDRDRLWAVASEVVSFWVPQNAGNYLGTWGPVSFSRRIFGLINRRTQLILCWIDVYYLVLNYMFRRLWPYSGWWFLTKTYISVYIWHASFLYDSQEGLCLMELVKTKIFFIKMAVFSSTSVKTSNLVRSLIINVTNPVKNRSRYSD